jgi:hypothetical protein
MFEHIKAEIEDIILEDETRGPTFLRLAWHSSGNLFGTFLCVFAFVLDLNVIIFLFF